MTVSLRTTKFKDTSNGGITTVHSIQLKKSNRKGVATLVGGTLHDGDEMYYIDVDDNQSAWQNNWIFRTGKSKRWQVLTTERFNKRFKVVK